MRTITIHTQTLPDEAAAARAGVDPNTPDLAWSLTMPAVVSILSVQPQDTGEFTFGMKTLSRAGMSEATLVERLEPWLRPGTGVVTLGGQDVGTTVLAMAAARSGRSCPHVASLALPPALRGSPHVRLMDEVSAGDHSASITLDQLCAGLGIPSAGEARGPVRPDRFVNVWEARKRNGEIQAVAMWLAFMSWNTAKLGQNDVMAVATTSLTDWIRRDAGDLRHLDRFARCSMPYSTSEALDPASLEPVF